MLLTTKDLKNLPQPMAADIAALSAMRLNEDVASAAAIKILEGEPLETALRKAKGETWYGQYYSPSARLDDPDSNLANTLFAAEEEDFEEKTRTALPHLEGLLTLLARGIEANGKMLFGAAAIAHTLKIGIRRAQQILKKLESDLAANRTGTALQGDMFMGGEA